jgi:hypothetical protein
MRVVVAFHGPCPQVIVYLDLILKECSRILPSQGIFSYSFYLALIGQEFHLVGGCELAETSNSCTFGLYLQMQWDPEGSKPIILECEFAAKRKTSGKFEGLCDPELTINNELAHEYDDLFEMSWLVFIADNDLFMNLRGDVAVVGQPKLQT